jgi:hypothetical protein
LFGAAAVLAALCACDTRRTSADPIDDCTNITRLTRSCYGGPRG